MSSVAQLPPWGSTEMWPLPVWPVGDPNKYCTVIVAVHWREGTLNAQGNLTQKYEYYGDGNGSFNNGRETLNVTQTFVHNEPYGLPTPNPRTYPGTAGIWQYISSLRLDFFNRISNTSNPSDGVYQPFNFIYGFAGAENRVFDYLNTNGGKFPSKISSNKNFRSYSTYKIICSTCSPPTTVEPPSAPQLFLGTAAPPPPPPKNMNCCDCNTIASIIESQMIARDKLFENIKDHIDQRIKEEITIHGKQLEALEVDLQPVIDRINKVEKNLWNGVEQ